MERIEIPLPQSDPERQGPRDRIPKGPRGITLLELCLVMSAASLVMAASLPGLANAANHHRLKGTTLEFVSTCRFARERAVSTGRLHEVRCKPLQNCYEVWTRDWDGGVLKEELVRVKHLDQRVQIQNPNFFGFNRVVFSWDGTASATGSVEFVEVKSRNRNKYRVDVLASTGKVTVR